MDLRAGLTSWDEEGIGRYVEERRRAIDALLRECFSLRGTWRVFRRTLRGDLVRHPVNFILSIPKLFIARIASVVEKLAWYSLARALEKVSLMLRSRFEHARERQIVAGLFGAAEEAEIRGALEAPLSRFMAERSSILELASGGLTIAVAYSLFGKVGLSPYEMGQRLAATTARDQAASRFFLGRGVGSAFYHLFPPHPTWGQIATASVMVIALFAALTAVLNLLSDPLQQALGIHRRQLHRLLDSFEDNLLVRAARRPRSPQSPAAPPRPRPVRTFETGAPALAAPSRAPRRSIRDGFASLRRKGALLPGQLMKKCIAPVRRIEARLGRRNALLACGAAICLLGLATAFIARQLDPYAQVRALVERKAYVTAVARLDQMPGKSSKQGGDYWYWRGRALLGNRQLDAAMDAYHSAIAKDARYRSDSILLRDAIDAVATKNHERAKRLILEQIGPPAIGPLREKALSREDIHRWPLVELIRKLGGEDEINYPEVAIADLAWASTCPAKKHAIEKVIEYRAGDAVHALRELDGQPQYKCLQGVLKQALATLDR